MKRLFLLVEVSIRSGLVVDNSLTEFVSFSGISVVVSVATSVVDSSSLPAFTKSSGFAFEKSPEKVNNGSKGLVLDLKIGSLVVVASVVVISGGAMVVEVDECVEVEVVDGTEELIVDKVDEIMGVV